MRDGRTARRPIPIRSRPKGPSAWGASIDLAQQTGVTYETAIDERGEFFRAIGGQGIPTTIFVRPGGEIADVWVGSLNADAVQELVADHLWDRRLTTSSTRISLAAP